MVVGGVTVVDDVVVVSADVLTVVDAVVDVVIGAVDDVVLDVVVDVVLGVVDDVVLVVDVVGARVVVEVVVVEVVVVNLGLTGLLFFPAAKYASMHGFMYLEKNDLVVHVNDREDLFKTIAFKFILLP